MYDKRKLLSIAFFVSGGVLCAVAWINRLIDAQSYGNVWLAFQTDSFMGWPLTHVIGFFAFVFMVFGFVSVHAQDKTEAKTQ